MISSACFRLVLMLDPPHQEPPRALENAHFNTQLNFSQLNILIYIPLSENKCFAVDPKLIRKSECTRVHQSEESNFVYSKGIVLY